MGMEEAKVAIIRSKKPSQLALVIVVVTLVYLQAWLGIKMIKIIPTFTVRAC